MPNNYLKQSTKPLLFSHGLLLTCLLLWYAPVIGHFLQKIDIQIFTWLNHSLQIHPTWMLFWGYLNHPAETWLNLVVMMGLNLVNLALLQQPLRKQAALECIYFWIAFQIVIAISHFIFSDILNIHRHSPSLIVEPYVWLSKSLHIDGIKDFSENSFPAGHSLVAIFWLCFSFRTTKSVLKPIFALVALLLCTNRIFSGAHWTSDVVFTICFALVCYFWAINNPIFYWLQAKIGQKHE